MTEVTLTNPECPVVTVNWGDSYVKVEVHDFSDRDGVLEILDLAISYCARVNLAALEAAKESLMGKSEPKSGDAAMRDDDDAKD